MTEKDYAPKASDLKALKTQKALVKTDKTVNTPKTDAQKDTSKKAEKVTETKTKEESTEAPKKKVAVKKAKKDKAIVDVKSSPISTKVAISICKFIRGKKPEAMIKYLEGTIVGKNVIPMKGEYSHQKGKVMGGAFPVNASEHFIMLLKSIIANTEQHDVENPVIVEAIANYASRPYGRFGSHQKKRTHIKLVAMEKKAKK